VNLYHATAELPYNFTSRALYSFRKEIKHVFTALMN
jgi:hypothetical protein